MLQITLWLFPMLRISRSLTLIIQKMFQATRLKYHFGILIQNLKIPSKAFMDNFNMTQTVVLMRGHWGSSSTILAEIKWNLYK